MLAQPGGSTPSDDVKALLERSFGSYAAWESDFKATGATRSVGWAILYLDPSTGALNNHFIELHENGNGMSVHCVDAQMLADCRLLSRILPLPPQCLDSSHC